MFLLEQLSVFTFSNNLTQHVNFKTWSRTINGVKKESLLDHVYSNAPGYVKDISYVEPTFGDHKIVIAELETKNYTSPNCPPRRCWMDYSKSGLTDLLCQESIVTQDCNVQSMWNALENVIINAVDSLAPIMYDPVIHTKKHDFPPQVKNKINKRKILLQIEKLRPCVQRQAVIRVLNNEINRSQLCDYQIILVSQLCPRKAKR